MVFPIVCSDEQVTYAYDFAGRVNSVVYRDGASARTLFSEATGFSLYDVRGRITGAQYGSARFSANYAATGRRLLRNVQHDIQGWGAFAHASVPNRY